MFLAQDPSESRAPTDDFWFAPVGMMSGAGTRVSVNSALRSVSTVFKCGNVLAQSVGQLPLVLIRKRRNSSGRVIKRERAEKHPLWRVVCQYPNQSQHRLQFVQMSQWHQTLRGNFFAERQYDRMGNLRAMVPLNPDRTVVELLPDRGSWRYRTSDAQGRERILVRDEVFHLRGLSSDGIVGINPIEANAEAIGKAMATTLYGAKYFKNDARPGGWIEHPGNFKTTEARNNFRESWQQAQTGMNRGKVGVLEYGMKFHELGVKNSDAQFLETMKYNDADIAGLFLVPPHKIGILDRATNNNIEHQGIDFVTGTLQPLLINHELQLGMDLLTDEEQEDYYFKFLVDGLLRGDSKARNESYKTGVLTGYLVRNEAREMEDRDPLPGLDEPLEPLNMQPAGGPDDEPDPDDKDRTPDEEQEDKQPATEPRQANFAMAAAERVVRKEVAAITRLKSRAPAADFAAEAATFYQSHADYVGDVMLVEPEAANAWCVSQLERALQDNFAEALNRPADLYAIAMEGRL